MTKSRTFLITEMLTTRDLGGERDSGMRPGCSHFYRFGQRLLTTRLNYVLSDYVHLRSFQFTLPHSHILRVQSLPSGISVYISIAHC